MCYYDVDKRCFNKSCPTLLLFLISGNNSIMISFFKKLILLFRISNKLQLTTGLTNWTPLPPPTHKQTHLVPNSGCATGWWQAIFMYCWSILHQETSSESKMIFYVETIYLMNSFSQMRFHCRRQFNIN